jgi:hypothetical protein
MRPEVRYRLAWLLLDAAAQDFLKSCPRRHAVSDEFAKRDRLCHHSTVWFTGECGGFDTLREVFPEGATLSARPVGTVSDDLSEALVVEIAGRRFQHGSGDSRLLHVTLSLARGVDAKDSVRLLSGAPRLNPVDWPDLSGVIKYELPDAAVSEPAPLTEKEVKAFMCLTKSDAYLGMDELEDGRLYLVNCRNAYLGIWLASEKEFAIRRSKLGRVYIFHERHWDTGEPYGTAKPYILLPDFVPKDGLLDFLARMESAIPFGEACRRMLTAEATISLRKHRRCP